MSKTIHVQNI